MDEPDGRDIELKSERSICYTSLFMLMPFFPVLLCTPGVSGSAASPSRIPQQQKQHYKTVGPRVLQVTPSQLCTVLVFDGA